MEVFLNGAYLERSDARVSIDDRGFLFGDGVYEVLRTTAGRVFEPERHQRRLRHSLAAVRIDHPDADAEKLLLVAEELIRRNGLESSDALVYMQVTRGTAVRTHYFPPADTAPTVFVSAGPFVRRTAECTRGVAAITHPDLRWGRCDIKSVNLLANVLANQYAHERGCYEAVLLRDGIVTEATHSAVFGVVKGELRTHPANERVLPSITREVVLELAGQLGIPVREEPLSERELRSVDELFLASTTADAMPVVMLDGAPVGNGAPGPIAGTLLAALLRWRATGHPVPRETAHA